MRCIGLWLIFLVSLPAYADLQLESFSAIAEDSVALKTSPVIIRESPYSFSKTVVNLKKAISGRNYRLIRVKKFDQGFVETEQESDDLIIYFCNFNLVNVAIKKDNRIGQFLPCRISIIQRDGKVYLMAMNPKAIGNLLHNSELKEICTKVTHMYLDIMDEVTI